MFHYINVLLTFLNNFVTDVWVSFLGRECSKPLPCKKYCTCAYMWQVMAEDWHTGHCASKGHKVVTPAHTRSDAQHKLFYEQSSHWFGAAP